MGTDCIVGWTVLLPDPAHARWIKIRVLAAEFHIKVSPQQRYSLKWNHSVWSHSKLNFPWCPAWQEALSGDWRSQAFGKQFTFRILKHSVSRSCRCVFIVYRDASSFLNTAHSESHCRVWNVTGRPWKSDSEGLRKEATAESWEHFHLEAASQGRVWRKPVGWTHTLWNDVQA